MNKNTFLYVSGWSRTGQAVQAGVSVYRMDVETKALTLIQNVDADTLINVMHIDRRHNILYALNETDRLPELRVSGGGRIFVYQIDASTGMLTLLGTKPTWCPNPSYITLDMEGKYAVVANHGSKAAVTKIIKDAFGKYSLSVEYDDSNVELFEVLPNGMLGELLDVQKHYGSGPEGRQASPRPHSAVMSPDGTLFAVCDKGNDTVRMYSIDRERGSLKLDAAPIQCAPATLPRYCVFHPTLPCFYHNNEKLMELFAYCYEADGSLKRIAACSALPEGYTPGKGPHEQQGLAIHPNGNYLYDIVRGPNVISVYELDETTGIPRLAQSVPVADAWPRGCTVSPDGTFLAVTGMDQGRVFVYEIEESGLLSGTCTVQDNPNAAFVSVLSLD